MPHLKKPGTTHAPGSQRIYFLMFNACGSGGVARTVINLANHLVERHEVEIISLFNKRPAPRFPIDPRIKVSFLEDQRTYGPKGRAVARRASQNRNAGPLRRRLDRRPSRLEPPPVDAEMSLLTDLVLYRKLKSLRQGILISTRPSLHHVAGTWAPKRMITIAQDHLNFPIRFKNKKQAVVLRHAVPRVDSYVVLTEADARDYREDMPGIDTDIRVIRNALSWSITSTPAKLDNKVVVAAGRLSPEKGFRRMISGYAPIARRHPDWQLHIYGHGAEKPNLQAQISRLGIGEQVILQEYSSDFPSVLAEASVYAMSSFSEGFPMVLLEAMSTGLPLVAFDCPRGPGEIIDDGKNGRLVDNGDIRGFTEALRSLIEDDDLRHRMGAQALEDAEKYEMVRIEQQWEDLFDDLVRRRRG
ncbi:MAG: glycosyltransferase family 4 protein [Pseudonocardia sp.]